MVHLQKLVVRPVGVGVCDGDGGGVFRGGVDGSGGVGGSRGDGGVAVVGVGVDVSRASVVFDAVGVGGGGVGLVVKWGWCCGRCW